MLLVVAAILPITGSASRRKISSNASALSITNSVTQSKPESSAPPSPPFSFERSFQQAWVIAQPPVVSSEAKTRVGTQ